MILSKWLLAAFLVIVGHFSASYLVPLDEAARRTFGGLLGWAWPWAQGNSGPLGTMSASGFPIAGFFIAVTSAGLFWLAALAIVGWWVPFGWWRTLAGAGAVLSLVLMLLFFGPTKIIPMTADLVILYAILTNWSPAAAR